MPLMLIRQKSQKSKRLASKVYKNYIVYIKTYNMINYKTLPWKWILFGAFGIFLLILLFGKCNTDKKVEKITVTVPDKSVIKERDAYKDTLEIYRKQIDNAKKDKAESDRLMKRANTELNSLIVRYNRAVEAANVPAIRETCDSIVAQNEQLFDQIGQYQTDMNELVDYYELALKASDSAAIKSNYLLMAANKSSAKLTTDYNDLAKVYNKEVGKAKRNRGLNRILAAALMGTTALILVK